MDSSNPYASPGIGPDPTLADPSSFAELVRAWEKLRLLYNGILLLPGLGVIALWITVAKLPLPIAAMLTPPVAIGANAAFFLGPLAELYFRALFRSGAPIGKGRWLIFSAGVVVSAGVFLIAAILAILASKK